MDFGKMSEAFEVARGIEGGSINARDMVNIVHTAHKFSSSIVLHAPNKTVDVKSFLGLSVTLSKRLEYKLEIHGEDEEEAKKVMTEVFAKNGINISLV